MRLYEHFDFSQNTVIWCGTKKKAACRPRLPKNLLTKVETFSIILHKRPSEPQSKQNFTFEVGVSKIEHSRGEMTQTTFKRKNLI